MTKLMAWVLVQFGKDRFAETLLADLYDTVGVGAQCVFLDFILSSVCSYLGFVHRGFQPNESVPFNTKKCQIRCHQRRIG